MHATVPDGMGSMKMGIGLEGLVRVESWMIVHKWVEGLDLDQVETHCPFSVYE